MALLDRFRAQPRQKHPDPAVRLAFVQEIPLTDHELLTEVAREDPDARVRRAAVAKLLDPRTLSSIATDDGDEGVRAEAAAMVRRAALEALDDHLLVLGVVLTSEFREPATSAVERFADRSELEQIASRARNKG